MSTFDLHRLGWHSFQQLCLTISREVLGQTVQSFLDSKDGGRDGAFAGTWKPEGAENLTGKFVIQCKFTSKSDLPLKLSGLAEDITKAKRLARSGRCDCYILLTNFNVSGIQDEKIEAAFTSVGVKQFRCFGADWICQQIRDSSRLRMLVPRVYGIGDLSQILDARAYCQARALLESMREDLSRVVLTGAYEKAIKALEAHGFVLLLGEPACGKTTIAAMLAMAAIDQWKVATLKLERSEQMIDRWNPEDSAQFFWIDDAFGVNQFELPLTLDWNRIFPKVRAMINGGARIVLTSRDYIYKRAKLSLKESAFPAMNESQVVIDVQDIKIEERRQILYNHVKLGKQPDAFRRAIKPLLEDVASHPRFTPETARRLGDPLFTRDLFLSQASLKDFVDRQEQLLREVIQGLDKHSQASLALIFMRNGALESPVKLHESEVSALTRLGSDLGEATSALIALRNSLTVIVKEEGRLMWRFKHPTVGDALGGIVLTNPEQMDIYILGASPEKLIATITCGEVGLERAVVVPTGLYNLVVKKLASFVEGNSGLRDDEFRKREFVACRFLAGRCDRTFLQLYLSLQPGILERVRRPRHYLDAASEVQLAMRLFKFDLLPEEYRKSFVDAVIQYAVNGEDGWVLRNSELRKMLTPEENQGLVNRLRTELIPGLEKACRFWESNLDIDEDPGSYVEPFEELLSALLKEFAGDASVEEAVENAFVQLGDWAEETKRQIEEQQDVREFEDLDYDPGEYGRPTRDGVERSIFDDVDR